jgi:hypothetical protein
LLVLLTASACSQPAAVSTTALDEASEICEMMLNAQYPEGVAFCMDLPNHIETCFPSAERVPIMAIEHMEAFQSNDLVLRFPVWDTDCLSTDQVNRVLLVLAERMEEFGEAQNARWIYQQIIGSADDTVETLLARRGIFRYEQRRRRIGDF